MIKVRLPDDSTRELPVGSTGLDLAQSIGKRLAQAAVATVIDGAESDLGVELVDGARVSIVTADSDAGRHVLRHSTAHVLAQAVVQLFEGAKFSIGPAIEDGFYYDFELPGNKTFSDADLVAITEKMQQIVAADQPFVKTEMSAEAALKIFKDQPYKCEIIQRVTKGDADSVDALEAGSADSVSRRLAVEMDLLSFPQELGGGLAVWHPKGGIVRKLMEDYSRERHQSGGYKFVFTPHLANSHLFETSGHLQFYKDGMYPPMEMDNGTYYPKPMNCPMHCLIYRDRQRSYRELPLRLFELGTVYRYERAGTLHGLLRIRGFTQDDSHIFCTQEQMADEIASLLDFVLSVLRRFGFNDFDFKLSTRNADKSVGSDEIWQQATDALREALNRHGLQYSVAPGDAAFYGPKIDIDVRDAIGRKWQLSTIQCDFNLPERFGLEYIATDNSRKRPIMLHRALFGSIERFFGVLLEHYGGAFPTWLAPVQVRVLAVSSAHEKYATQVVERLVKSGYRVDQLVADEQLGKRIRASKLERIPYVLVVGDDDVANMTVGVNPRGGEVRRDVGLDVFLAQLKADVGETQNVG
ncbi:MAG: threonine--tRNA ligase [Actinobacteria bacterium]|nr:threonine--tRNA ligase [Actinomycetota bacterium]